MPPPLPELHGLVVLDRLRVARHLGMNRSLHLAAPALEALGTTLHFVAARTVLHFLRAWGADRRLRYDFALFNSLASLSPVNAFGYRLWQSARALKLPVFIYWHETRWVMTRHLARFPDNAARLERVGQASGTVHLVVSGAGAAMEERRFPGMPHHLVRECALPRVAYDPDRPPASPPLVVNVASIQPRKGVDLFVETAVRVCRHHPDARFIWLGNGENRAAWAERVAAVGLADRVRFPGYRDNPHATLLEASLLFLSSRDDPMPLSVLEAMALARPVVCFDVGGAPEALGVGGRIVPAFDVDRAAQEILAILSQPPAARPRPALRERYLAHFTPERFAARLDAVLRQELIRE